LTAPSYEAARRALHRFASPAKAKGAERFFKTGPGEYGEGDRFLGLTVPRIRAVAKEFKDLGYPALKKLLRSKLHEERLFALIVLVKRYEKHEAERERVFAFYFENVRGINNWDLVDTSAPQIVGGHPESRPRALLYELVRSKNLWERRIAVLATFHFIRRNDFADTLRLCEGLLEDPHDLMAKACGWMLREVGKRDQEVLERFLDAHHARMPRTMLRYSLERLPARMRQAYMAGKP
jgi:3-methyladenine DNA glycosylase AlkD